MFKQVKYVYSIINNKNDSLVATDIHGLGHLYDIDGFELAKKSENKTDMLECIYNKDCYRVAKLRVTTEEMNEIGLTDLEIGCLKTAAIQLLKFDPLNNVCKSLFEKNLINEFGIITDLGKKTINE